MEHELCTDFIYASEWVISKLLSNQLLARIQNAIAFLLFSEGCYFHLLVTAVAQFDIRAVHETRLKTLTISELYLIMEFTSRQLRAFLLVAEHRSFTRAADSMFVTPSGLSILIREMETQLGFRLFDRTTRLVAPTGYGIELLAAAQRCLAEWDAATSRVGRTAVQANQSLSLGAAPLISANVITPAIKEFRGHHPHLRIQLFDGSQAEILQRIGAGKLDMGLGVFAPTPGIRRTPFFRFSLMVIRPEKDPAFRPASTTWSALKGETLISLQPASPIQRVVEKYLKKVGVAFRRGGMAHLLDTQIAMVEADEGIAIIPSYGLAACRNRRVTMIPLINPVVSLEFHQISNRGTKLSSGAVEFTTFLKSYIARWAGRAGVM